VAAAAGGVLLAARLARRVAAAVRTRRALTLIAARSRTVACPAGGTDVLLAPARERFCFAARAGGRGRIFVSTAAWEALEPAARDAMLAHERAHIRQGDLRTAVLLDLASLLCAPIAGAALVARWRDACERSCDREAARAAGPIAVAEALLAVARGRLAPLPAFGVASFHSPDGALAARVEALLRGGPDGRRAAGRLRAAALAAALAVGAASALLADPLHHALETLLGAF
jgi:Zn-dependent protease with chaperone function